MVVHLITGGAGFVGVNLAKRLLAAGGKVLIVDDLSRGKLAFIKSMEGDSRFRFMKLDCSDRDAFQVGIAAKHAEEPIDEVWHMAANSDIPAGVADPRIDMQRTFMTTFATLEVMRALKIPVLHFASSSAVYGDLKDLAINEMSGPLEPISNYGAMKLASEAQIRAAVESWLERADIFRFPNVIGVPATHGVLIDFVRKLRVSPDRLDVLGNGTQQKIYLHVDDLVAAMLHITEKIRGRFNLFNIGPADEGISVREIAEIVRGQISPGAVVCFGKDRRGWVGDVPKFRYDISKIEATGWLPQMGSKEAIRLAVEQIAAQESDE